MFAQIHAPSKALRRPTFHDDVAATLALKYIPLITYLVNLHGIQRQCCGEWCLFVFGRLNGGHSYLARLYPARTQWDKHGHRPP